jgi:polysaccharide export outer membrane protein
MPDRNQVYSSDVGIPVARFWWHWVTASARAVAISMLIGAALLNAGKAQDLAEYRIGPGDRLKVSVFGHPEESGEFEVDATGTFAYTLLGRVQAKGRTSSEIQTYLRDELDRRFIVDPKVTIEVLRYRPFYIYGEVEKSGSYAYVSALTVRRAVAIAGGFTRRARHAPVSIVREDPETAIVLEAGLDVPILPGDIIEVRRRLF